jgi:hypothetical protein
MIVSRPMRSVLPLLLIVFGAAACQPFGATTQTPSPTVSMDTLAPPTEAELEAIRFRTDFGLRADLAYVRGVAANPSASSHDFGVPLLPAEWAELNARQANAEAVRAVVDAEAALEPDDFCGRYLDNEHGGAFTSMWRANLEAHRLAILSKVGPTARVAFRDCTFSEAELDAAMDQLSRADQTWMAAIPARATSSSVDTIGNRIEIDISSAAPDARRRVLRHYLELLNLPAGMLYVVSDGTGAVLVPWGTVSASVVGPDGQPARKSDLSFDWISTNVGLECGGGDIGYGVSWDGRPTLIPCQAGTWTILVVASGQGTVGSAKVTVVAGKTVPVTIHVSAVPTFPP